jgi:exodeoxyribonuclease V alpha subunit
MLRDLAHAFTTHGLQFRAQFLKTSASTSVEGMEKYLASGMIHGIGPIYAKRLIKVFDDKVFDVIQSVPERLREVDGIGPRRAQRFVAAWAESAQKCFSNKFQLAP